MVTRSLDEDNVSKAHIVPALEITSENLCRRRRTMVCSCQLLFGGGERRRIWLSSGGNKLSPLVSATTQFGVERCPSDLSVQVAILNQPLGPWAQLDFCGNGRYGRGSGLGLRSSGCFSFPVANRATITSPQWALFGQPVEGIGRQLSSASGFSITSFSGCGD